MGGSGGVAKGVNPDWANAAYGSNSTNPRIRKAIKCFMASLAFYGYVARSRFHPMQAAIFEPMATMPIIMIE